MGEWTQDAWWVAPDRETIEGRAREWGVTLNEAAARLLEQREMVIGAQRGDPYRHGYEPQIWWVAWALMDFPYAQESTLDYLARRLGDYRENVWGNFKKAMRKRLGFDEPVRDLLVMGANRSSKTDFGAKTIMRFASNTREQTAMFLAQQYAQSAETVQPRLWQYMPKEWKLKHMGEDWYVHYKDLKGFSEAQFQLPTRTKVIGKFYSQDPKDALVGSEATMAWADEMIPINWMDELGRRLASKRGQLVLTFTPLDGYTPVVKSFLDGASVVKSMPAYLLPRDGGERWPWAALGMSQGTYEKYLTEVRGKRLHTVRATNPEDCVGWIETGNSKLETGESVTRRRGDAEGESGESVTRRRGDAEVERVWEMAPRVARCFDPRRAVIWFEVFDNPYSVPAELIAREADKGADRVRTVLYGIAVKSRSATFASYNEVIHVIDDAAVPAAGINYCIMDPAGTRNDALIWVRSTPWGDYVYREWPGTYHIPGVGVPGQWAKASGRNKGWNDGDRDEGSDSFGFGFARMKYEVARLEGWRDYLDWAKAHDAADIADGIAMPSDEEIEEWDEARGSVDGVVDRFMDSRPAGASRMTPEGEVTLLEQWNRMGGWDWNTTPGDAVKEGTAMIVDALAVGGGQAEPGREVSGEQSAVSSEESGERSTLNEEGRGARLRVAKSCRNVRFALATYTGADAGKGAVKDWIDMLRYFYRLGLACCRGADPVMVARVFGSGARGALVETSVVRRGAGGREVSSKQLTVSSGRVREVSGDRSSVNGGREGEELGGRVVARAGGVRVSRGARVVWRGRR